MSKTEISDIEQQAADWFVRVSDPQVEEDQLVAFMAWLNQAPEHEAAYERTERMWKSLDSVESDFVGDEGEQIDDKATQIAIETAQETMPPSNFKHWGSAIAASLVIVIAGYFTVAPVDDVFEELSLQTAIGEQKTHRLFDQSEVVLNTNSEVRIVYTEELRQVYLNKGEAYFNVAKHPDRPFVVFVAGSEVKALGTAFNVRLFEDHQVIVSLDEGRVAVVPEKGTQESVLLPGQQAQYSKDSNFVKLQDADLEFATQWRTGQLSFVGVPLEKVILEINRYTPTPLVLLDAEIGKESIDAYFQIDNLDNFLMGLDQLFDIESIRSKNRISLRKRNI